ELPEAEKIFKQALDVQPDNADLLLEIAGIYLQQNKMNEAESSLAKILSKDPRNAEAFYGLGEVAHSRQKIDIAENYYKQALAIQPKNAETHNRLGQIKYTKGFRDLAVKYYETAISIQPDNSEFWRNLAQSQLALGQLDKAHESIDQAIKISPNDIDAITTKAGIYEKSGNAEASYKTIKPVLDKKILDTGIATTYASICHKLGQCNEAIEYLDAIQNKLDTSSHLLQSFNYTVGKLFDKLGNYDRAFKHFEAANNATPSNFSAIEHSALIERIMHVFNWQFMSTTPRPSSFNKEGAVFIIGMPRSGTSLVEQILDSHPDISGAGELSDISIISNEIVNVIDPETGFPECYKKITSDILEQHAKKYLDKLSSISSESRYVTDKMPQNFIFLGLIALMFPKAKIIHCVRNSIDTCLSIYFQHFNESHNYATRLEDIASYYKEYRRLMAHWKMVLPLTIHDINYEELVNSPKSHIHSLLNYLDLDWSDNCLNFHKSSRHVPTASYDQVTRSLYTSSQGRWKNYKNHIAPLLELLSSFNQESNI
ncbi:MAG: sulfotransferase, partial [Gammaproteobacteria bacterium]|nr:sulfotransferase [Gammaproteobacteria bacterium]